MKKLIFTFLLAASPCLAGTFTAISCSQSNVNAVINGPTHVAVNGDKIIIPAGTCTWTTAITINGVGIDITGTGTPNTGAGTVGAGTSTTTIIAAGAGSGGYNQPPANGSTLFYFENLTSSNPTSTVELLNLSASGAASLSILAPIQFIGTCTTSAPFCASVRVDNITFTANTWETALEAGFVTVANVFGVADHNSATEATSDSPALVQISYNAWQGVGTNGDNSYASADTFGTVQAFYIENNSLNGVRGSENDANGFGSGGSGGDRYVCRFNTITNMSGTGLCSAHGTSWTGRNRGQRQVEVYYNTVGIGSSGCDSVDGLNSGTGYYFSNSVSAPGGGCNEFVGLDIVRFITSPAPVPFWLACGNSGAPWDQAPFTSTSLCVDQPGRGPGNLLAGGTSTSQAGSTMTPPGTSCSGAAPPACYPAGALDPIYESGEVMVAGGGGSPAIAVAGDGSSTRVLSNRDYYAEVSQSAQTSATSPFNGTTGTGFGTLARRPTTCTPTVGYWATDQGTWNNGGAGGVLYLCLTANTWTASYTPYTYPHPLTGGSTPTVATPTFSPAAGTITSTITVTLSCATAGATITYTTDGSTPVPGSHGTVYTIPFQVTASQLVQAIGSLSGSTNSAVGQASYQLAPGPVPGMFAGTLIMSGGLQQ